MFENFPYNEVGRKHNEYARYLLQNAGEEPTARDIVRLLVSRAEAQGDVSPEHTELLTDILAIQARSRAFRRKIGDLGFSEDLLRVLNHFRRNVGADFSKQNVASARETLSQEAESLRDLDGLLANVFAAVYQHSTQLWSEEEETVTAYSSSHVYIDLGAVATVDAAAAATYSGAVAFGLVAPPAAVGLGAAIAIFAAFTSLIFLFSGEAEREIEREPITPGPAPDDGGERPPILG